MPALSLLKRSSRESPAKKLQKTKIEATAAEAVEDGDGRPGSVSPTTEKRSRRNSTRDLLHDLINRSLRVASLSTPQRGKAAGSQRDSAVSTPHSSTVSPHQTMPPAAAVHGDHSEPTWPASYETGRSCSWGRVSETRSTSQHGILDAGDGSWYLGLVALYGA